MSDLINTISKYTKLEKKSNDRYVCECPLCNDTKRFMVVAKDKFACFTCGATGDENEFNRLYQQEKTYQKSEPKNAEAYYEINKIAATRYHSLLGNEEKAKKYFEQRGLTAKTIKKFGLGYAPSKGKGLYDVLSKAGIKDDVIKNSGLFTEKKYNGKTVFYEKFWDRVMFPIMDLDNRVIGFGGRILESKSDKAPKYLNSPATVLFDKSNMLYAMNYVQHSKRSDIILCEGYMDVISLHQAGFDNATASLGTALTKQQANLIAFYTDKVHLIYDSDDAGNRAKLKAIPLLKKAGVEVDVVDLSPHKDPDEFIKAEGGKAFEERLACAESSYVFEIRYMKNHEENFKKAVADKIAESHGLDKEEYVTAYREVEGLPQARFKKPEIRQDRIVKDPEKTIKKDVPPEKEGNNEIAEIDYSAIVCEYEIG